MQRSRGFRSKSRRKMTKVVREGRSNPITNKLQKFEEGDLVHITINPSIQKGQPHPRFHGKTGKITDKKGKAYIVSLTDGNKAKELIEIHNVSGDGFEGTMMVVNDPSKISLATTYPWGEYGKELGVIVDEAGAIAGVNGGIYYSSGNKGGRPYGVTVSNGEIQDITLGWSGLYLIGFDENNLLRIISLEGMNKSAVEKMVKEEKIRDAISFQEESSDANNHFVKLIINGEKRELSGKGSGQNPRTAIGQRKDGSVLILVTDGRGKNGHLGATASDLIEIMAEYGAVNAANVDGGSSSSLYYNKKYLRTSVTFYYTNSSWRLPTAFVVKDN